MALNLADYTPTQWVAELPITAGRMNNLETGVNVNREAIQSLDSSTTSLESQVSQISSGIGANEVSDYVNKTLWQAIKSLYTSTHIEGQAQAIAQGQEAYTQIVEAVGGYDELGNLPKLSTVLPSLKTVWLNFSK